MKLPTNKKERIQVLALVGVGGVAVLYAVVQLLVSPLIKARKQSAAITAKLSGQISEAEKEIRMAAPGREEHKRIREDMRRISRDYVLHEQLGQYLLGVSALIEKAATNACVRVDTISELGIAEIPGKRDDEEAHTFRGYNVSFSVWSGYDGLVRLCEELESSNPYLAIMGVSIASRATPDTHVISLRVQWPIWADREMEAKLDQESLDLEDETDAEGGEADRT